MSTCTCANGLLCNEGTRLWHAKTRAQTDLYFDESDAAREKYKAANKAYEDHVFAFRKSQIRQENPL